MKSKYLLVAAIFQLLQPPLGFCHPTTEARVKQLSNQAMGELWLGLKTKSESVRRELDNSNTLKSMTSAEQVMKLLASKSKLLLEAPKTRPAESTNSARSESIGISQNLIRFGNLRSEAVRLKELWSIYLENSHESESAKNKIIEMCGGEAFKKAVIQQEKNRDAS
jgi:hypothetical protein